MFEQQILEGVDRSEFGGKIAVNTKGRNGFTLERIVSTTTGVPKNGNERTLAMNPSHRLTELGLILPTPARPAFKYVPVVVHGGLAFVSGQLPWVDGEIKTAGLLGATISLEQGKDAARICGLQALACLEQALGSIDQIVRIIKLTGFVQSTSDFHQQPSVIDAASELMFDIFGEEGRHARSAIGVAALPRNAPVELEVIVAVRTR